MRMITRAWEKSNKTRRDPKKRYLKNKRRIKSRSLRKWSRSSRTKLRLLWRAFKITYGISRQNRENLRASERSPSLSKNASTKTYRTVKLCSRNTRSNGKKSFRISLWRLITWFKKRSKKLCHMKNQDLIGSRVTISTREPSWKTLITNKLRINFPNTNRSSISWIAKLRWKTGKSKNSILTKDKSKWTKNWKRIKSTSSKNKTMIWINRW